MLLKREGLWLLIFCTLFPFYSSANCKEKRCRVTRVHGLKTSDCYNMEFTEIPKCLPSNVEVIELSHNRIRKIGPDDLRLYSSLANLYLSDNLLVTLKNEVFSEMTSLETLDLSMNALSKIPPAIFQLPSLKTLYLGSNMNMNIADSIEKARPIKQSSLTKLDISHITESDSPTDFPDFTDFPLLANLNITGDAFNLILPKHFAQICNLQILSNENVTTEFQEECDCWKINRWLTDRNVKFSFFNCPIREQECLGQEINQEEFEIFDNCNKQVNQFLLAGILKKVGLWVGVIGGCILLLVAVLIYWRWKKRRERIRLEKSIVELNYSNPLLNNRAK